MTALELRQIATSLHLLRLAGPAHQLNVYLWVGADGVTLIDTGWSTSSPVIEEAVNVLGRSRTDVRRIVLTHFHDDHTGSASEIVSWGNVEVVAGQAEASFIQGDLRGPVATLTPKETALVGEVSEPPHGPACRVDRAVSDGDVLPFAGGSRVLTVPGHTPGSIALFLPEPSAVLTGDAVAELNEEVIVGPFNTDRPSAVRSAQKLAATSAQVAGSGHGEPVLEDAHLRIFHATDPFAA